MKNDNIPSPEVLRQQAEELFKKRPETIRHPKSEGEMLHLIQELELQKLELEIQNEAFLEADKKLQRSEEKYRSVFESMQDAFYEVSIDGTLLDISPSIEIISKGQYTRADLIGTSIIGCYLNNDDRNSFLLKLKENGRVTDYEISFKNKDGSIVPIAISSSILFENNVPVKITGSMRDITERKQSENALRESEERYRSLANSGQALIWTADIYKKCTYFNQVWLDYTGRTFEQEYGDGWAEGVHPDDLERCFEIYSTSFDKREPFGMVYRLRRHDGEYRYLQDNGTPQYNSNGEFIGFIGHCLDISELKLAEEALSRSEEKYRNIFLHAQEGVFQTRFDGSYISVNPALAKMYGFDSPEELMKSRSNIAEDAYSDPHERENFLQLMKDQGFVKGYEYEVNRKDGQKIWFYEDAKAIKDDKGNILFFEGFVVDITDRKHAEDTLKDKTALLTNLIINLQEGILLENSKRQIALTNQLFCDMFGIPAPPALLTGADCSESAEQSKGLFKNPKKFVADIDFILANKKAVYSDELELVDGRYFERDYIPTYLGNEYSGHLWKYRDITERKQSLLKIEESEARFNQVVGQSREVVWEVDALGLYTYISPLSIQVYGYTPEQMVGKLHFYDIAPKENREEFKKAALNVFAQKIAFENLINSVCSPDGEVITVSINGIPMLNDDGDLIGYRGIDADITERLKIETALKKSEESYRFITERSNDLIFVCRFRPDLEFEYISPSAEKITGFLPEEFIADPYLGMKLVHLDDQHILKSFIKETLQNGIVDTGRISLRWIKKDGSVIWTETQNSPIYNEHGEITGIQGKTTEVTERKQTEFIQNARIRLMEFAASHSRNELQQKLLDELEQLTGSNIGFFHAVNADQETLILQSWSSNTKDHMFKADIKNLHLNIDKASIWAESVHLRKAVIHNDYSSVTNTKGIPEGLAPVIRELVVPVFRNNLIVAIVGIGNKDTDYNERDLEIVSRLSDLAWDITERKGAEESFKKLSQAVEQSPEIIYITNSEGLIEYVNPKAKQVTGYNDEELIGKNPRIFKSGEKPSEEYKTLWQTISTGGDWKGEFHNKKKNGELYWVAASISPVTDNNGKIIHYLAVEEDITEWKKVEEKSRLQNERLNAIVSAMPDLIFVIDQEGTYCEFYSSASEKLLVPDNQIVGSNIKDLFNQQSASMHLMNIQDCILQQKLITYDYSTETGSSASFYEARLAPLGTNKVLCFVREITERKKAEKEIYNLNSTLEQKVEERTAQLESTNETLQNEIEERKLVEIEIKSARIEAEKANLAKSEFLSRMSHELRTPMNSILGFAQLMEMGDLNPAHRKGVNHILKSGKHLLDLINEVLDISKIEAGYISLLLEPVQLNAAIKEMMDVVQNNAETLNQTLELKDSPTNMLCVKADQQRLKQVLLNLINNAVKYNYPGGSVVLETELLQTASTGIPVIRISVTDTGIGISHEDIQKLFLPFERIGAESTEVEGTGLGLTVVKKLMDVMGGKVGVVSTPGEGSTFWIELPVAESKQTGLRKNDSFPGPESTSTDKSTAILYIEDNSSNVELVEQILSSQRPGIRLISSKTGDDSVDLVIGLKPDLVLLDLNLPGIHGSEVIKLLQADERTKDIPVIIISADAMPHQLQKLLRAGAKNYLTKPLDVIGFLKVVDEWIGKR